MTRLGPVDPGDPASPRTHKYPGLGPGYEFANVSRAPCLVSLEKAEVGRIAYRSCAYHPNGEIVWRVGKPDSCPLDLAFQVVRGKKTCPWLSPAPGVGPRVYPALVSVS